MGVFTTWTVLPHKPIEKLAPNLWRVSGTLGKVQRQMVLARMADGRVFVHNAIALDDAEMAELEAWGEPSILFVPNGYHRQDAAIWKQRYPKATVVAPPGSRKRVEKVVHVDLVSDAMPGDDTVRLVPLAGMPAESLLEVKTDSGTTLVFCDAILNMPKLGLPMSVFLGPTGMVSCPRASRMFFLKDKRAFARQLDELANKPGLERVLFAHGKGVTDDPAGALRNVVAQLR